MFLSCVVYGHSLSDKSMAAAVPPDGRKPAAAPACTLTSDVHNEAELLFQMLQHKDKLCVSSLDCLTILRGMGMNPTQVDMEQLLRAMAPYINELDDLRREEERKRDKEKKKEEERLAKSGGAKPKPKPAAADAKGGKDGKGAATGKDGKPGDAAGGAAAAEGEDGEKVKAEPAEEVKNIDWEIFITCVEPMYKDNRQEEREILAALGIFDQDQRNTITKTELKKILSENGESVLSPAEIKQFDEMFKDEVMDMREFAQRLQGTYVPPPAPSAEEIAAKKAEEERIAAEAAKREREANGDDLLS